MRISDWSSDVCSSDLLPAVTGRETLPAQRASYLAAWREVLPAMLSVPHKLVLRDFHVDNLMVVAGRSGIARCGLLDFQDAVIGPISYALVSLLEDARRAGSPAGEPEILASYPDRSEERRVGTEGVHKCK